MYLPRSRSATAKHCLFLVLCVLLAGHALVERLSGQVVTGQVIDSTSSVTIVVSYRARMTYQSRRTCASLTARSGDIVQSIGIRLNIHVRDTVTVHVVPWHPEGIVFYWQYLPPRQPARSHLSPPRLHQTVTTGSRSMPVYIEPGHELLLHCPQDLTWLPLWSPGVR